MKLTTLILLTTLQAAAQIGVPERRQAKVPVCVINQNVLAADVPVELLAERLTTKMFADIGVGIEWQHGRPPATRPNHCILTTVTTGVPRTASSHALAAAGPFETNQITVFLRRIKRRSALSTAILFSYVLTHEITHLLEDVNYHAPSGIMKSHWDAEDFNRMDRRQLTFTPSDISLIHLGLASRHERRSTE